MIRLFKQTATYLSPDLNVSVLTPYNSANQSCNPSI